MKISVCLAVYNGSNFLEIQLNSFLEQSVVPDEIVAVDDCSTDSTYEILQQFGVSSGIEVKLLRNEENLGSTISFSKAIAASSGDIIFLSDHDDVWYSKKIEMLSNVLKARPEVGLVFTNTDLIDENGAKLGRMFWSDEDVKTILDAINSGEFFSHILIQNYVGGATSAFRAIYKDELLTIPKSRNWLHDRWIAAIISSLAEVCFINSPTMGYRQHSTQQIGRDGKKKHIKAKSKSRREFFDEGLSRLSENHQELKTLFERLINLSKKHTNNERLVIAIKTTQAALNNSIAAQKHFEIRSKLKTSIFHRIKPIFRELIKGNYRHYSNGFKSVLRDIIFR